MVRSVLRQESLFYFPLFLLEQVGWILYANSISFAFYELGDKGA